MENIVNAVILANNKILTVKRKTDPWAGMYGLPGGHIEEKENKIEALKREIKEETGFEIGLDESNFLGAETLKYASRKFDILFYKAKITGGEPSPQKEEIEEIKWLGFDEFIQGLKKFGFSLDEIKGISKMIKLAAS
ncbi:MAG: NUDIX hydrolase [Candidatus Paceibacterota bacterium]|jgi:ADP-ribose pyrophosphatase YjhB (NUDIX family)